MNADEAQRIFDDPGAWLAQRYADSHAEPTHEPQPGENDITVDALRTLTHQERLRAAEDGRLDWILNPTTERN